MNVLVIVESCFGNTAEIAEAVAAGLRSAGALATVSDAASAPPLDHDLVVVGAPTHNLGLPTPASRERAVARGGSAAETGVAEWLAHVGRLNVRAAAFDTAVPGAFSGSAAKKIEKRLRHRGATVSGRESFVVSGNPAALTGGELDRARAWGLSLAR